jgi:hypothetical protein
MTWAFAVQRCSVRCCGDAGVSWTVLISPLTPVHQRQVTGGHFTKARSGNWADRRPTTERLESGIPMGKSREIDAQGEKVSLPRVSLHCPTFRPVSQLFSHLCSAAVDAPSAHRHRHTFSPWTGYASFLLVRLWPDFVTDAAIPPTSFNVTVPCMCCLPQRTNASNTSPRALPFGVSV